MKRVWLLASGALLLTTGCTLWDRNPPIKAPEIQPVRPPMVRADDVTPANAHAVARALNEELDWDLEGEYERP